LRNQPVLIDADVAELYGVETKRVNEAVKNNPRKFPYGYLFELDKYEKTEVVEKFDHLKKLKFSKVQPTAFTERGLYMLATIPLKTFTRAKSSIHSSGMTNRLELSFSTVTTKAQASPKQAIGKSKQAISKPFSLPTPC